jgi:ubiquinone/menaquinone biosynthesis C-methylase UbiE
LLRKVDAWGVENNQYIHSQTPKKWRSRNMRGDVRTLPFEDESFDFVYETCLRYLPENSIDDAIRELFRICRIGVVCGSIATDMTREIIDAEDLFYGVETFASMWEWGECSGDLGPGRPPAGLEDREEIKRRGGALVSGR